MKIIVITGAIAMIKGFGYLFIFLWGWEAVEYGEIPPFCVYAICLSF